MTNAAAAAKNPVLATLARVGYAMSGVLHILIGVLAIAIAVGSGQGSADQSGALGAVASNPAGIVLLWVMALGLFALALWELASAALARESDTKERWKTRLKNVGKAAAYIAVGVTALSFALGSGNSSGQQTQSFTATLLQAPGGVVLVVLVGLGIVAVGGYFIYKGARKRFTEDLRMPSGTAGQTTVRLGMVGYIAKGAALLVVGILFCVAAVTSDPSQASGLDGAVRTIASLPFGAVLLVFVGLGFIAYGLYCFVRAKNARL
jgi:MFS family permease